MNFQFKKRFNEMKCVTGEYYVISNKKSVIYILLQRVWRLNPTN